MTKNIRDYYLRKVIRWGSKKNFSLAMSLPVTYARTLELDENSELVIKLDGNKIILSKNDGSEIKSMVLNDENKKEEKISSMEQQFESQFE